MIGIIVDGPGDYASFKGRFNRAVKVLKTDGPRGHTPSIGEIVSGSRKQVSILQAYRCERIIVLFDFEMRKNDYASFVQEIEQRFQAAFQGIPVDVAVPNRMIENWYLADIEWLSMKKVFIKNGLRQKNYEGTHGKNELKRCFAEGYTYSETKHGPQLFAIVRFDVARKNSPSLEQFLRLVHPTI
jgi:hypothetical protein